jgi:hypothetical protein
MKRVVLEKRAVGNSVDITYTPKDKSGKEEQCSELDGMLRGLSG